MNQGQTGEDVLPGADRVSVECAHNLVGRPSDFPYIPIFQDPRDKCLVLRKRVFNDEPVLTGFHLGGLSWTVSTTFHSWPPSSNMITVFTRNPFSLNMDQPCFRNTVFDLILA